MLTHFDAAILRRFAAPGDIAGSALLIALFLAEVLILIGPLTLVWLWILGDLRDRRAAVAAALAGLLALGLAGLISSQIDRPRPFVVGLARNYLDHVADSSLPSDHAALLFALAAGLALRKRSGSAALLCFVGALVGAARVYLGAHYPSDIAASGAIGLASALVFALGLGARVADGLTSLGDRMYNASLQALRRRAR